MLRILEAPVADRAPAFTRMPPRGVTDASEDCVAVLLGNPAVLQATVEQKKSPKSHPGIRSPIPLPFFVVIYLGAEDEEPGRLEECCALFPTPICARTAAGVREDRGTQSALDILAVGMDRIYPTPDPTFTPKHNHRRQPALQPTVLSRA